MRLIVRRTLFGNRWKVFSEDQFGGYTWLATFRTAQAAKDWCTGERS